MTIYNWLAISISMVSLILSLSVAYFSYFRAAQIKTMVGHNLIVFNSSINTISGKFWGGLTFVLPITFSNWEPRGSSVYQVRLVVGRPDNPQQYFDLAWSNFVKFVDGVEWENEDVAQPIAMPGRTSVSKFVRFDWSPLAGEKFNLSAGQYELFLLIWSSQSENPDIQNTFLFTITEDIRNLFQKTIDE